MNKQLWDEFLSGKTVINCRTENQAKKFLRICEGKGIGCISKASIWCDYIENTCFRCMYNTMSYATTEYYKNGFGCKVITFKQLMKSDKPEQRQYKGWEILKMIEEGILKEGDIVIWHNGADSVQEKFHIGNIHNIELDRNHEDIYSSYLGHYMAQSYWTIGEEKHYLTFDEARKTGKKFKYRGLGGYLPLDRVMYALYREQSSENINKLMDERVWEVEA